jgi:hypothetical protein
VHNRRLRCASPPVMHITRGVKILVSTNMPPLTERDFVNRVD